MQWGAHGGERRSLSSYRAPVIYRAFSRSEGLAVSVRMTRAAWRKKEAGMRTDAIAASEQDVRFKKH